MPCSVDNRPSCIILAGGRGKRMQHADKGLIEINGKKLIDYVLDSLNGKIADVVISANRNQDTYKQYTQNVITDDAAFAWQGPLAGIASCLPHCQRDIVLVTSCDIPVLPDDLVHTLLHALGNHDISVCEVSERLQPVFIMRKHNLSSLHAALKQQQRSLLKWIRSRDYTTVPFQPTAAEFLNINSPQQLNCFLKS